MATKTEIQDLIDALSQKVEEGSITKMEVAEILTALNANSAPEIKIEQLEEMVDNKLSVVNEILEEKQSKIQGYGLSETSFSQSEKNKLSTIVEHYAGRFVNAEDLFAITGKSGDYAYVSIDGAPTVLYAWNGNTLRWDSTVFATSEETPESIKSKYESNADTNNYSDLERLKLGGIASQATKNDSDANLKNRANHTGTQGISTITDLSLIINAINTTNDNQNEAIRTLQLASNTLINSSVANNVRIKEYVDRFEYSCKIPYNVTVVQKNYNSLQSSCILPVGVTIDSCDEHYISVRNDNRIIGINIYDSTTRYIWLGFNSNYGADSTAKGSVFIKLIKYK